MSARTKSLGVVAAIAAIAVAIPTAVQAFADPATVDPAAPTTASVPPATSVVATPTKVPDPQGPGCDAYRKAVPTGAGSIPAMAAQTASQAIANNQDLSTFSAAISGKLNPRHQHRQCARRRPLHRIRTDGCRLRRAGPGHRRDA